MGPAPRPCRHLRFRYFPKDPPPPISPEWTLPTGKPTEEDEALLNSIECWCQRPWSFRQWSWGTDWPADRLTDLPTDRATGRPTNRPID